MRSLPFVQLSLLSTVCQCGLNENLWAQAERTKALSSAGDANTTAAAANESEKDRATIEKFLELLKRRPRFGTAFDKVYGFHVSSGTVDELAAGLEREATEKKNGNLWLVLGMLETQRSQDARAVSALEKAEGLLPADPIASYYLGKSLVLLGHVERAAEAFQRAINKKPSRADMLEISQELGRIFQRIGRHDDAQKVWTRLEADFPGDQQVQEEIAAILAEEGANEAALVRYDTLAKSHKDRVRQTEMSIRAAQLRAILGKRDAALAEFELVLAKVNPDSWIHRDVRKRIEDVFLSSQDYDGLIGYYKKWIDQHPDDVDAMMRAGRQMSIQRRSAEAQTWFRKSIEKAPTNTEARQALVDALVAENSHAQAAREMAELVKLQPDNVDYIVRWGELTLADEKLPKPIRQKQAAEIWKRMMVKRGTDAVTVSRVGDLLRGAELAEDAIAQYKAAIQLADAEPQYREYLGEYLHQLGRKDEALAVWNEIASGPRQSRDNWVRLSEVLNTFHYPQPALAAMAKACELRPTFAHRARYAELLKNAKQFDAALAQLDLAESIADDVASREMLIDERVKIYRASETLSQRIIELEKLVASERSQDAESWRLLALMHEADSKYQPAATAIQKAVELAPANVSYWTSTARMQERTGNFGESISAYRKLMTLDRRFLSNYLTQIASLEMRLGNVESALKAGQELLASAAGNSEHFRFFADLCFQAGRTTEGLETLRRNVRGHANDVDAINHLARFLAAEFQTEEAIELYWRVFDLEKDVDGKIPPINALAELYLRTNRFDTLLKRLETLGREENKTRDAVLWMASAHQAAGDLGMAKQMLERLVREDSRDTKLLEQLVSLSRAEFDYESAAEYQRRLNAVAPSQQGDYLLASLMLDSGRISEAESLWMKLSARSGMGGATSTSVLDSLSSLIAKEQFEIALTVVQKALAAEPDNWEYFAPAMQCMVRTGKTKEARELAERVKTLTIPPSTLSTKAKQASARSASQRASSRGSLAIATASISYGPQRALQMMSQIKGMFQSSADPFSSRFYPQNFVSAFGDTQAMADGLLIATQPKDFDIDKAIAQKAATAKKSRSSRDLWDALYYMCWKDPNLRYQQGMEKNAEFEECLELLVKVGDLDGIGMKLDRLVNEAANRRRNPTTGEPITAEPLSKDKLAEAEVLAIAYSNGRKPMGSTYETWLCGEWLLAGENEKAERLIAEILQRPENSSSGLQVATLLLQSKEPDFARVADLIDKALSPRLAGPQSTASAFSYQVPSIVSTFAEKAPPAQTLKILDRVFRLQANHTARLRPSEQNALSTQQTPGYYVVQGVYVRATTNFPPPSGQFDITTLTSLKALYDKWSKSDKLDELKTQLAAWTKEAVDDRFLRLTRHIALATVNFWSDDREMALANMQLASEKEPGSEVLDLLLVRLLYESGKASEALAIVDKLRPANAQMMVDRELTILQLALQMGDIERAKQSTQKLFALRLNSETEFKLADLTYQLGMKDLGDRMMERIQRRAGGKQDTLIELMNRYLTAGQKSRAAEIVRQVMRRTRPRAVQNFYTSENQQHEQALRVLVQSGEADGLIKQMESQFERSPKSTLIADSLAALYEATGKRAEAQKIRLKAAENVPSDPRSMMQAAMTLAATGKHAEAVDKFLEAVRKDPNALGNSLSRLRSSFSATKSWSKIAALIEEIGPASFRTNSYVFNDIGREFSQSSDPSGINRFLEVLLKRGEWEQVSYFIGGVGERVLKLDNSLKALLLEKLVDPKAISSTNSSNLIRSYGQGGVVNGPMTTLVRLLCQDKVASEKIETAMSQRLEKNKKESQPRILLALAQVSRKDWEKVQQTVQYWLDEKSKDQATNQAVWLVCGQMVGDEAGQNIAISLLEPLLSQPNFGMGNNMNSFEYTPGALLTTLYIKSGRKSEAKEMLMKSMREFKTDESISLSNPGYGEYQLFQTLHDASRKLAELGFPEEAYVVYRRLATDKKLQEGSDRWNGNSSQRYLQQLDSSISEKLTGAHVTGIVTAALGGRTDAKLDSESLRTILGISLSNTNLLDFTVSFPVSQFMDKIVQDERLKQQIVSVLDSHKSAENASPTQLTALFLAANAAGHAATLESSLAAIDAWLMAQPAPKPVEVQPSGVEKEAPRKTVDAQTPPNAQKSRPAARPAPGESTKTTAPPPEELVLLLVAEKLADNPKHSDLAKRLIERALAVATASGQSDLAMTLECQLVKYIQTSDPDRAKQILMTILDKLLPPTTAIFDKGATKK